MKASTAAAFEHWESYYRRGELTTCPMGTDPNYSAEVRAAWEEFFTGLPDGTRLIDLCTGNGAVALIAKESGALAGKRFEIHGVDRARIQPALDVAGGAELFAGIAFHPGVAAEALPFEAHSMGAVCGQYALEYTDAGRVLPEIARVLGPGGRAQFIMHSEESVLYANGQESQRLARLIFERLELFRRCRELLAAERSGSARLQAASQAVTRAAQRLAEAVRASVNPHFGQQVGQALDALWQRRGQLGPAATERELDYIEHEAQSGLRRVRDITRVALSRHAVQKLGSQALAAGLTQFAFAPQLHAGHVVGWRVSFARA